MKLHHLFENEIPKITKPHEAYGYVFEQKRRVPELESVIIQDPAYAYLYAKNIIKGRWPEAESTIMKDVRWANAYLRDIPEVRNPSKDVPLVLGDYVITDVPNTITDEQVLKLIKLINPSVVINALNALKIKHCRLYNEHLIKQNIKFNSLTQITASQLIKDEQLRNSFTINIGCKGMISGDFE